VRRDTPPCSLHVSLPGAPSLFRSFLFTLIGACLAWPAAAQQAGDIVIEAGWVHSMPREDNGDPRNQLRPSPVFPVLGVESSFASEGVRIHAGSVDTLGLIGQYFMTDHWALKLVVGYPPKAGVDGTGIVRPTGPTGEVVQIDLSEPRFNPIGRARQWVPVFMLGYYLGPPSAELRPYFAVGFTYAFFTEEALDEDLKAAANQRFGDPLALAAGIPGPTTIESRVDPTLAPAFGTGLRWNLSEAWSLSAGFDFIALDTHGEVFLNAADGTQLARSRTQLRFNPVNVSLLAGYRF